LYDPTQYRWGGKSPLGIDCSGLTSMAYMLNGILTYRNAQLKEGFPIHEIKREDIKEGDLLYWPGHIAMYIGDERYVHCTAHHLSPGMRVNSLNPAHDDYREDLATTLLHVGSFF
jgi:cell wall-associated NlpC family hydrolase